MQRVWLAAAEASGDVLGARLAEALRAKHPSIVLRGLAGPAMEAAGVQRAHSPFDGAVGLAEVVARVPAALRLLRALERDIASFQPDVVCTIDSPTLLLRLARRVRPTVPTVHWVAPQLWAWRPGRAQRIAGSVDAICCLLPFEPPWFNEHGGRAVFTGHPGARVTRGETQDPPVLALLPGSRSEEIHRLWPVFRDVAAAVVLARPEIRLRVGLAPGVQLSGLEAEYVDGASAALDGASAALVCSGTATLEAAARGVPQVVAYQVNPVTWALGRAMVRGVRHVALPNLLTGRAVAPEHLQYLDSTRIAADLLEVLDKPEEQRAGFASALRSLRPDGAVERVALELETAVRARRSSPQGQNPRG